VTREAGAKNKGGGFTLVELLVAVSVLAVTMMLVYGVYASMFRIVDQADSSGAAKRSAQLLFDQLQRDIFGMYKGTSGLFKAEDPGAGDSDAAFLQFVTSSHLKFDSNAFQPQLVRVSYSLEKAGNSLMYDIYRTEYRFELADTSQPESGPVRLRVGTGISALSLTYKDADGVFFDRWEARASGEQSSFEDSRFPSLIRVELQRGDSDQGRAEVHRFPASFRVPAAQAADSSSAEGS